MKPNTVETVEQVIFVIVWNSFTNIFATIYTISFCYRFSQPANQACSDRSKAVLLLWFFTVTCSCCPYLYFGSAIMLVTYFSKF